MLYMSEEAAAEKRVSSSVDSTTASHTKVNVQRTCGSKGFRGGHTRVVTFITGAKISVSQQCMIQNAALSQKEVLYKHST